MKRNLCSPTAHTWRRVRGGKREECITCGTSFPCLQEGCGHVDCHEERGEALPEWIVPVAAAGGAA